MAGCGVKGGYTKVVYGTTVGMTTTVEITSLLSGTQIGAGEALSIEDAAGQIIATGYRQPFEIHTALVTGSVITALQGFHNNCTPLWFRFYATGGTYFKVGGTNGVKVTLSFQGAGIGDLHRHIVAGTGYVEDSGDIISVNT